VHLEIGARTDTGRVRQNNEDSFGSEPDISLFVVSDGMGGAEHGEIASAVAVATLIKHCRAALSDPALPIEGGPRPGLSSITNRLLSAVRCAHSAVYKLASDDPDLRGMGATIVAAWVQDETLSLAHVGDSRAYRLRSGNIEQLTHDHSLVAEQVRLGLLTSEQAADSKLQTVLTRALGHSEIVDVDVQEHVIRNGDTFLLCSDGLSRMVSDAAIAGAVGESLGLQAASDRLIQMANNAGGEDNITAVLFRAKNESRGWLRGLRAGR
jgi:PPM family protein phosphatase